LFKNWTTFLQNNFGLPETVEEAVGQLLIVLAGEYKVVLATMQEEDLMDLRFSLGMAIQNVFGLDEPGNKLLASCGVTNPDDVSGVIIRELWRELQN